MMKYQRLLVVFVLGLTLVSVLPYSGAPSDARMYVDTYPPSGSGNIIDEAMRPGQIPVAGASKINSYASNHTSGYGWIKSYPQANTFNGSWTTPAAAYDRNDLSAAVNNVIQPFKEFNSYPSSYATNSSVKSPSSNSADGTAWTSPTYAYSSDDNYAFTATNNARQRYGTYGFNLPGALIGNVEVGTEAYTLGNEQLRVEVTWDGGTTWSTPITYTLPASDPNTPNWLNFTSATAWTGAKLSNANFLTRVTAVASGGMSEIRLDHIPVRVTFPKVTNPSYAYDKNQGTGANCSMVGPDPPASAYFEVKGLNYTGVTLSYPIRVDIKMNYAARTYLYNTTTAYSEFQIGYYVGSMYQVLVPWAPYGVNKTASLETWASVYEPNDGAWSLTDIRDTRIIVEIKKLVTGGTDIKYGSIMEYETWVHGGEVGSSYLELKTFDASGSYNVSTVDFRLRYEVPAIMTNCLYRILYYVKSKYSILKDWTNDQLSPAVDTYWENQPEPNDGRWNITDIDNIQLRVETKKEASTGSGTFKLYEINARFTATPYSGVTDPTKAYDRNTATYAEINAAGTPSPGYSWFEVKDFNTTIPMAYHVTQINVSAKFRVPGPDGFLYASYRLVLYVGTKYVALEDWSVVPVDPPELRVYANKPEPNDGVWNWTDIHNARIRVETTLDYSFGSGIFDLYEAWLTLPVNRLVIGVSVENVVGLWSYGFSMNWSAPILDVKVVDKGTFLKQGGNTNLIVKWSNNPTQSNLSVSETLTAGTGVHPVTGSGTLTYIEFLVEAYGMTNLHLYGTSLKDSLEHAIPHSSTDGYFDNRIPGDIDTNRAVNAADLYLLGKAYGSTNPDADINKDGTVDTDDLRLLKSNYGRTLSP